LMVFLLYMIKRRMRTSGRKLFRRKICKVKIERSEIFTFGILLSQPKQKNHLLMVFFALYDKKKDENLRSQTFPKENLQS